MKRISIETQKRAVKIILCGGMTVDEVAVKLEVPPPTVRKWKDRYSKQALQSMALRN